MSSPSPGSRRMQVDVVKLIESNHEVTLLGDEMNLFSIKFSGPPDTPYFGGVWKLRVNLPDTYPFKSPSIGFMNKIYHPNIDEASGTLLTYPNAQDPLNGDAAALYLHKPEEFRSKVRDYVQRYATEMALKELDEHSSSDESSISDFSEDETEGMEL